MGHIRLGRIPKTKKWAALFDSFQETELSAERVASAVLSASEGEIESSKGDETLSHCFWLLCRIVTASRSADFVDELAKVGIQVNDTTSGLAFLQRTSQALGNNIQTRFRQSVFSRMAESSFRDVLTANILEQSRTLFGSNLQDVQLACRSISTTKQFGQLAREFFSNYISQIISYAVDKEISNYVGPQKLFASSEESLDFNQQIESYCYQSARVVEEFAGGWLSKHNWERGNEIPESDVVGFTAYALEKLQMDLRKAS